MGITSQNPPEKRWHNRGTGYSNQGYMKQAIKKYGWENVQHIIVFQTYLQECAFELEKVLIRSLHTNEREFGYNISSGGEAGAKGVYWSEERKHAYGQKYRGANHPMYGKHHSEDLKQKLRMIALNRPPVSEETRKRISEGLRKSHSVSVVCYETGERFDSLVDAAQHYNLQAARISVAVKNFPNETCGGYHWYKYGVDVSHVETPKSPQEKKPVVCVETGQIFESIGQAALNTGYDPRHISRACKDPTRTVGGFHWQYYNETNTYVIPKTKRKKVKVMCLETGEIFESLYQAGKTKGCLSSTIGAVCAGRCYTAGGYHWRYADV